MALSGTMGCIVRQQHASRYGLTWNRSHYPDWEPLVGRQPLIETYSSNPRTIGPGLLYERRVIPYVFGVELRVDRHRFIQTFQEASTYPSRVDGIVDGWYFEPYLGLWLKADEWIDVQIIGGPVIVMNRGTFEWLDRAGLIVRDRRTHTGLNWQFGTSATVSVTDRLGVLVGFQRTDMFRRNADNSNTVYLGAVFNHVRIAR
jgi:hypothetical protein